MGANIDKLKGKLKKAEGDLTGDKVRQGQGWAEEKKGDVEGAIDKVADKVDEKLDRREQDRDADTNRDDSSRR
jgi:uncharacterized protein YjbJ (UPF0337 family)